MFRRVMPCSGSMELYVFRKASDRIHAGVVLRAIDGPADSGEVRRCGHYLTSGFVVRSKSPMFLQLDGEAVRVGDEQVVSRLRCYQAR